MSELRLTDDIKEQLYGVLPFSQDSTVEYTPQAYERVDPEFRPTFILRCFNRSEQSNVERLTSKFNAGSPSSSLEGQARDCVRKCLLGWDNLLDVGSGEFVSYESDPSGGCAKACFDRIPSLIIVDIFMYIGKISGMMDIEKRGLRS